MSASQRRKVRRLRSWWRQEQQSIAKALTAATHHIAQQYGAPRSQKLAVMTEEEEVEYVTHSAPQRLKTPALEMRPAPLRWLDRRGRQSLSVTWLPRCRWEVLVVGIDGRTVRFFLQQNLGGVGMKGDGMEGEGRGRKEGRKDGRMQGRKEGWDGWDGWDGWMDGWMDGWKEEGRRKKEEERRKKEKKGKREKGKRGKGKGMKDGRKRGGRRWKRRCRSWRRCSGTKSSSGSCWNSTARWTLSTSSPWPSRAHGVAGLATFPASIRGRGRRGRKVNFLAVIVPKVLAALAGLLPLQVPWLWCLVSRMLPQTPCRH